MPWDYKQRILKIEEEENQECSTNISINQISTAEDLVDISKVKKKQICKMNNISLDQLNQLLRGKQNNLSNYDIHNTIIPHESYGTFTQPF